MRPHIFARTMLGLLLASPALANTSVSPPAGTTVDLGLPSTSPQKTGAKLAEHLSTADYKVKGGGVLTYTLSSQAIGDKVAVLPSMVSLTVGKLLTSPLLPVGTTITGIVGSTSAAETHPTSAATPVRSSANMGNALVFATAFGVPVGTGVAATGVPAGAQVVAETVNGNTSTVYLDQPTSGVASGATVTFTPTKVTVALSAGWLQTASPATPVGLAGQDDGLAFQNATFFANVHNGGTGLLFIPSGYYYASTASNPSEGLSVETGSNVVLLPGSQPVGGLRGASSGTAAKTIASVAQNSLPSGLNINQTIYQQAVPTNQTQGILVNQHNINCVDDGGPFGCGMVGQELQQDMEPNILSGIMWGYHTTDYIYPGQLGMSWVGAELEVNDNSGTDKPTPGGNVVSYGSHLDLLGNTNGTAGIYFGASGAGRWHYGMACPQNAIINDCWSVHSGVNSTVIAGVDMNGNLMAQTVQAAGAVVAVTGSQTINLTQAQCGTVLEVGAGAAANVIVPAGLTLGCRFELLDLNGLQNTISSGTGMGPYSAAQLHTMKSYGTVFVRIVSSNGYSMTGDLQ